MLVVMVVAVAVVLWAIMVYNSLIQLRVRGDGAWADINVQLKRRYDLVPNLVETVKGYAGHEQRVFQQVSEARSRAMQASAPSDKATAEGALSGALKSLFAVAEQYPQLRASDNFTALQQSLAQIEEALQGARRYYNAVVRDYNTKLAVLPDRVVAQLGGFTPRDFFQLDRAEERSSPRVQFP